MVKNKPTILLLTDEECCNFVAGDAVDTYIMSLEYFNDSDKLMMATCGLEITAFISAFDKKLLNELSVKYVSCRLRSYYYKFTLGVGGLLGEQVD